MPSAEVQNLLVTYTDSDSLSLMDICGMVSDLRKIVHRPVDLIEDEYLMPFARKSADRDKIKIYERAHVIQNDLPLLRPQIEQYIKEEEKK